MNDLFDHARTLGQRIDAGWQRADVEAQLAGLHARQQRRARRRALAAVAAAAAVVAGLATMRVPSQHTPASMPRATAGAADTIARATTDVVAPLAPEHAIAPIVSPSTPAADEPALSPSPDGVNLTASGALSLGDGSVVTPLGKDSRLLARQVSETDVVVALTGGGARFDVPVRPARRFRAELGTLALETRGAAFRVRLARAQVEVIAERGEVSVRRGAQRQVVAAGEARTFATAARVDTAPLAPVTAEPPMPPAPASTWREAAARADYAAAWLAFAQISAPLERMEDLLLAGDVGRLSGHPEAAVLQLTRAVERHPEDPRAPLAAFTLGRVQLEDMGAPRDAALAFARARSLAPDGPLAEDALAREVEAWSRAGETETARSLARTYTARYPRGHRLRAVLRFGGLEQP